MNIDKFLTMDLDTPSMKAGDWLLSAISIGVGVWLGSYLWIGAGLVGCVAAVYRPLTKLQKMAQNVVMLKNSRR